VIQQATVQHFAPERVLALSGYNSRRINFLKIRLDKLLVDRALAASRERAHALILAGKVQCVGTLA